MTPTYSFRPAERRELPLLRTWLRTPEVVRWWGDPETALLTADLDEPRMSMLIVACDGAPFAYAQHYDVHEWPQPHFACLPPGWRAIDAFIGEPGMIGRGHGAAFPKHLAMRLIAGGAAAVAIDPDVDNVRARRAYHKAGFRGETAVETAEGRAILMIFEGSSAAGKRVACD